MKNYPKLGLSEEQKLELLKQARRRFTQAKAERQEYEQDMKLVAENFLPHRWREDETTKTKRSKWAQIINPTPRYCVRTLMAGMQSGMTNRSKEWFMFSPEDQDLAKYRPVREWTYEASKRAHAILARSNFYNTQPIVYGDSAVFGAGARLRQFDYNEVVRYTNLMPGRYWVMQNHLGMVDQVFIELHWTVEKLVNEFGDYVPQRIKSAYDNGNYAQKEKAYVGIFPNPFAMVPKIGGVVASNQKKFVSVYWMEGSQNCLAVKGYDLFPVQVPRWEATDDEPYGIGVGLDTVGLARSLQMKEREKALAIKKLVRPARSAPDTMRSGLYPATAIPGTTLYRPQGVNADQIVNLEEINLPLQYLLQDMQQDESSLRQAYYVDLFLMLANIDHTGMTATEIAQRSEEKLLALGPVVERLSYEDLDKNIEGLFNLMANQSLEGGDSLLPPPPPELQGVPLKIEYTSVLTQAQRAVGMGSLERFMSFVGGAAQIFPEAARKIDPLTAVDRVAEMLNIGGGIVRDNKDVQAEMAQASQQQQMMQMAQMGMAAADGAQKLGNTPLGDSTALNRMLGVAA